MKSKIVEVSINYPCLRMYNNADEGKFIVLFYKDSCGIVVNSNNNDNPIGAYSESWKLSEFENFEGSVNLSNG